ncbi:MAG: 2-amino-4-hydroxy-6-hydroxymethyldihydropteridine diphosphokinase [Candidatus Omnitrophica bacterium]|nr:2-amino-4-hydroxy-6-hydroxymethyldihydropteridine diphosphokinase [Candidatus Omnitrophota bacterium]
MQDCFVGLGSNLGNKRKNLLKALQKIKQLKETKIIKASKIIQSMPLGGPKQPKFLNAVIKLRTELSPLSLLKKLKNIEAELGRKKTVRWGPRVIDLDILLYSDRIIETKELTVPHPRIFERDFVIKPLLEVL